MAETINMIPFDRPVEFLYLAITQQYTYDHLGVEWIPLTERLAPIAVMFDKKRRIYRILSLETDCRTAVINSTLFPDRTFEKTSGKFGYWKDKDTRIIYGITFVSEYECDRFAECFRMVRNAWTEEVRGPPLHRGYNTFVGFNNRLASGLIGTKGFFSPRQPLKRRGSNLISYEDFKASTSPDAILPSWANCEERVLSLCSLVDEASKTHTEEVPAAYYKPRVVSKKYYMDYYAAKKSQNSGSLPRNFPDPALLTPPPNILPESGVVDLTHDKKVESDKYFSPNVRPGTYIVHPIPYDLAEDKQIRPGTYTIHNRNLSSTVEDESLQGVPLYPPSIKRPGTYIVSESAISTPRIRAVKWNRSISRALVQYPPRNGDPETLAMDDTLFSGEYSEAANQDDEEQEQDHDRNKNRIM